MQNAVENFSGSDDLISIRSRGVHARPFTRVQALESQARAQLSMKELEFQSMLRSAEMRLQQIGSQGGDNQQVFTQALVEERKRILEERNNARQELRKIRRTYRQGVETMGNWLFFINTFLVPILLIIFSLLYYSLKRRTGASKKA